MADSSYFLNRVRQGSTTTGTGSSIVLEATAFSNSFLTMTEAGAVDGRRYSYIIEENNDFEIQVGQVWTAGTLTLARGTPVVSKVGGVAGTTKMDLQAGQQIRVFASAEDLMAFFNMRSLRTVTAASDALLDTDSGGVVIFNRATAISESLPQAGASSQFLSNWNVSMRNIGAGEVTITPTTSTINGQATLTLKQHESAILWSDGTNYYGPVIPGDTKTVRADEAQSFSTTEQDQVKTNINIDFTLTSVFTTASSTTRTKPSGVKRIIIEAVGAGGGGGGADGQGPGTYGAAAGGAGGNYGSTEVIDVSGVANYGITIGAAGAAGAAAGGDGGNGGNTQVTVGATTYTWGAGNGGNGHSGTSTTPTARQDRGTQSNANVIAGAQRGGNSLGSSGYCVGGNGGSSPFGTGGIGGVATSAGNAQGGTSASGYGAGGGGGCANATNTDAAGGAGGSGYVRIYEYS